MRRLLAHLRNQLLVLSVPVAHGERCVAVVRTSPTTQVFCGGEQIVSKVEYIQEIGMNTFLGNGSNEY